MPKPLCGSQQTVENSSIDGNTRPPDLPPEKFVNRSRSNRTVHGTIDWFQIGKERKKVKLLSRVRLFAVACTRLLRPWDFLGKSTGVGCYFLLQGIFPTQGLNPGLSHCRQMLWERNISRLYIVTLLIGLLRRIHHVKCRAGRNKLESRWLGEISITSDMQMTPLLMQKVKN